MKRFGFLLALLVAGAASLTTVPEAIAQPNIHIVEEGDTLSDLADRYGTTVSELRAWNGLGAASIRVGQRIRVRVTGTGEVINRPRAEGEDPADVGPSLPGIRPADLVAPEPIPTGPPPPPPPPATINRLELGPGGVQALPSSPQAESRPAGEHVVRAGDTLFSLAQRYGTTVDGLRRANNLSGDNIAVGQRLRVPGGGGAAPAAAPPPVRPGRYDVRRSTLPDDEVHVVLPGETLFSIAARYGTTAARLLEYNTVTTGPLDPGHILVLPDGVGREHFREPAPPRVDEEGLSLIYPSSYIGRRTISGEDYDPDALTASHRTLPFGTLLRVISVDTGRETLVRINDRGPVAEGFLIELSDAAARALGLPSGSAARVQVQVLQ